MEVRARHWWRHCRIALLAIALCAGFVPHWALAASPQGVAYTAQQVGGAWNDGFQVQNLDPTRDANIIISYYLPDGSKASGDQFDVIPANRSKSYYRATMTVPDGFDGAITIVSDARIAVIANQTSASQILSGSYQGIADGATRLYLPLLMRGNGNWNTKFVVQNLTASNAQLTLEYFQGSSRILSRDATLGPHASLRVDQTDMTELPQPWVGAVVVSATQPVAAVVDESNGGTLMSYSGLKGGATQLYAPLIMNDNAGWFTGLQVQNIGDAPTDITLKVDGAVVATQTVVPGTPVSWYPIPGTSAGFVGSATVTSAGEPIVGIVNEWKPSSNQGMSYTAFGEGSTTVFAPLVMQNNGGWNTGLQVQNIGANATDVSLEIDGASVAATTLQPSQSVSWYPIPGLNAGYVGSARVTSSGEPIVGIVNEVRPGSPGENSMAYEAFNQ